MAVSHTDKDAQPTHVYFIEIVRVPYYGCVGVLGGEPRLGTHF